jgi:hypothetical protein
MNITDLNGKEIIVTDLPIAIMQADDYRHYRVCNPAEHDLYLYKYWEDVYQKLLLLDTEIKSDN